MHLGAHTDAPSHYGRGAPSIEARSLDYYLGPCRVLRVSVGRGESVPAEALETLEAEMAKKSGKNQGH